MSPGQPQISPADAHQELEAGRVILLDVRTDDEWAAGHAPGATHMRLDALRPDALPADAQVVAVCLGGGRSAQAAEALQAAGVPVRNLTGGMNAWARAGLPVVRDDGSGGVIQ